MVCAAVSFVREHRLPACQGDVHDDTRRCQLGAFLEPLLRTGTARCLASPLVSARHDETNSGNCRRGLEVSNASGARAVLAAAATYELVETRSSSARRRAEAVLAWVEPHVDRVIGLGGSIAILAESAARKPAGAFVAVRLFDLVMGRRFPPNARELSAEQYGNALRCAIAANHPGRPVDRTRALRWLAIALQEAGDDDSVQFNAAVLAAEMGNMVRATRHLTEALRLGIPLAYARKEPLLRRLLPEPLTRRSPSQPGATLIPGRHRKSTQK